MKQQHNWAHPNLYLFNLKKHSTVFYVCWSILITEQKSFQIEPNQVLCMEIWVRLP